MKIVLASIFAALLGSASAESSGVKNLRSSLSSQTERYGNKKGTLLASSSTQGRKPVEQGAPQEPNRRLAGEVSSEGRCGPDFDGAKCSCEYDDQYCSHWGWCGFSPLFVEYEGFDGAFNCDEPSIMTEIDGDRCFTGSAVAVTRSCTDYDNGGCCQGENSCANWDGPNTVCIGACSGKNSCNGLGANNTILKDACDTDDECEGLGYDTTVRHAWTGNKVRWREIDGELCFTGTSSAVTEACDYLEAGCCTIGLNPCWDWEGINTVCANSCTGEDSCRYLGSNTVILSESCTRPYSCESLGRSSTSNSIKQVGPYSCRGSQACEAIGRDHANGVGTAHSIVVGANSCHDNESCFQFGWNATMVTIAENSCHGFSACGEDRAFSCNTLSFVDKPGSCHGRDACMDSIELANHCKTPSSTAC